MKRSFVLSRVVSVLLILLCFIQLPALSQSVEDCSELARQLAEQEETSELKILSWNIHMLPAFVYRATKKRVRSKEIVKELNARDYNIIVFQEAFQKKARAVLWEGLKEKYPHSYGPHNRKALSLKANSGIWILSDRPLEWLEGIRFNDCESHGCLGRQGAVLLEGCHEGNSLQLLGTHTNGGPVNEQQFLQIKTELLDKYSQEDRPIFICGDFNSKRDKDPALWDLMLEFFGVDNKYVQVDGRSEKHKKFWVTDDLYDTWPDFIFVRPNKCRSLNVIRIATISIGTTWVQGKMRKKYPETVGLSDHYPVEISLQWMKEQN